MERAPLLVSVGVRLRPFPMLELAESDKETKHVGHTGAGVGDKERVSEELEELLGQVDYVFVRPKGDGDDGTGDDTQRSDDLPEPDLLFQEDRSKDGIGDQRKGPERSNHSLGSEDQSSKIGETAQDNQAEPEPPQAKLPVLVFLRL